MTKRNVSTILSIAFISVVGFYSATYSGSEAAWVRYSLGGVFYEIFWCLVVFLFLKNVRAASIALGVLAATCALEFLQLWHPPFLETLRSFYIGRILLGNFFTWADFPYYFAGASLGWLWMLWLREEREED